MCRNLHRRKRYLNAVLSCCKIEMHVHSGYGAMANLNERSICIPAIFNKQTFTVAMHEIGHIMCGDDQDIMRCELRAWDWAHKKMKRRGWWDAEAETRALQSLETYRDGLASTDWRPATARVTPRV